MKPRFAVIAALIFSAVFVFGENPVHFRIKSAGAREAPPTIEDMLFMVGKPTPVDLCADLPSLCSISNGDYGVSWRAGGWQRPLYIAEFSGLIQIPSGNDYTFLVRRPYFGPIYFLIDGEPIVDYPNRHAMGFGKKKWRRRHARPGMDLNLATIDQEPGALSLSEDVKLPKGWIAGKTIHLEKGTVEFRLISFCEHRLDPGLMWVVKGQAEPSEIPAYLFKHADSLRHTGIEGRKLVYRAADARLAGVPAFCYEEDAIRPEIHLRSGESALDVVATMSRGGRAFEAVTSSVDIVKSWGRVVLSECRAGECDLIDWVVRTKDGEQLASGAARILKAPFEIEPDRIEGAAFMHGSTNCIFVSKRWGEPEQPEVPVVRDGAKMVFVNGLGDCVSNYLDHALELAFEDRVPEIEKEVRIGDLSDDAAAMLAAREHVEMLNAVRSVQSDFVLLAPEIRGARAAEDIGLFERRLAAIVEMFSAKCGRNIVLVTPPQGNGPDMRPYSEVVHRIADAHGLRTADLYTLSRIGEKK